MLMASAPCGTGVATGRNKSSPQGDPEDVQEPVGFFRFGRSNGESHTRPECLPKSKSGSGESAAHFREKGVKLNER